VNDYQDQKTIDDTSQLSKSQEPTAAQRGRSESASGEVLKVRSASKFESHESDRGGSLDGIKFARR